MTTAFKSIIPHISPLEKAIEDVSATALARIEPEIIKRLWSPDEIPAELFSVLAHALSVDLWDDAWSDLKKRSVLRRWVTLEFSKGTFNGYNDFIEVVGGKLEEYILPPGGIFASPDLSKEEWDRWIDQQPRVIIKLSKRDGEWLAPLDTFAGETFSDTDFIGLDDGYILRARRAVLRSRRGAEDEDLQIITLHDEISVRSAAVTERVILPAEDPLSHFASEGFAADGFVGAVDTGLRSFSYRLDRSYIHKDSLIWLNAVPAGFEPRDTRYYRVSDTGDAGAELFSDDSGADDYFVTPDLAAELLGDVLYLHNPDIAAPMVDGNSFANASRISVRPFHAEFRIRLDSRIGEDASISDVSFADEGFAAPEDLAGRESILRAIDAAKAKRDRILVTFQNRRRRGLGDGFQLGRGATIGGYIDSTL